MTKNKTNHDSRVSDFAKFWNSLYQAKYNRDYIFAHKRDYAIIKRLLSTLDSQSPEPKAQSLLESAAERLFNGSLKWFKGTETIGSFSTHINHLLNDKGTQRDNAVRPTTDQLDAYARIAR